DVLIGSETITASGDKTVGLHTASSPQLKFGRAGAQYIYAVLDSGSAVSETDETNNKALSAQTVNVTGTTDLVIDDGDPGFSTAGTWVTGYQGQGYQNDVSYAAAGSGSSVATWQASGLGAGTYDVQVTWSPNANRATDAPYRVYDGATLLATVRVNQELAPSG